MSDDMRVQMINLISVWGFPDENVHFLFVCLVVFFFNVTPKELFKRMKFSVMSETSKSILIVFRCFLSFWIGMHTSFHLFVYLFNSKVTLDLLSENEKIKYGRKVKLCLIKLVITYQYLYIVQLNQKKYVGEVYLHMPYIFLHTIYIIYIQNVCMTCLICLIALSIYSIS